MIRIREKLIEGIVVLAIVMITISIVYRFFGNLEGSSSGSTSNFFESAVGAFCLGFLCLVLSVVEFRSLKTCYEQVAVRVYKAFRSLILLVVSIAMFVVSYNAA